MSPEEKELLSKCVSLAEDNNKILHSLRRSMRMQRIISILYWVFIIGSAVGAYYLIQPYVDKAVEFYGSISGTQQKLNKAAGSVQDVFSLPSSLLKGLTN